MDDKNIKALLKTLETQSLPPEGLKESMLSDIVSKAGKLYDGIEVPANEMGLWQRLFFEKPLSAAAGLSVSISAILWAIFRDGYVNLLTGLIGAR